MRKIVTLTFILLANLFANEMPPMPPMSGRETKSAPILPKECSTLPPMIIFLPPPMEEELIACKNLLNMPSKEKAQEALKLILQTKEIQIKSISAVSGFKELYSIKALINKKDQDLYCNSQLTHCFYPKQISKNSKN